MRKVLQSYGLSDYDIEMINSIYPSIEILDEYRVVANIEIVIKMGYPREDIAILLLENPSFLSYQPYLLERKLKVLSSSTKNLESLLKASPYII